MKLSELVNSQQALGKLIKVEMPIKKAYELRKFITEVDGKLIPYNATRDDLIRKYGEDINGQTKVKEENIQAFIKDLNEILEEEIEIAIPDITIDDLDGKMETETLIQLSYLIK